MSFTNVIAVIFETGFRKSMQIYLRWFWVISRGEKDLYSQGIFQNAASILPSYCYEIADIYRT